VPGYLTPWRDDRKTNCENFASAGNRWHEDFLVATRASSPVPAPILNQGSAESLTTPQFSWSTSFASEKRRTVCSTSPVPTITKPADLAPLVLAIGPYKSLMARADLRLTMLTGLRLGVVAAVPWDESTC
jgi:hypothetical protein